MRNGGYSVVDMSGADVADATGHLRRTRRGGYGGRGRAVTVDAAGRLRRKRLFGFGVPYKMDKHK